MQQSHHHVKVNNKNLNSKFAMSRLKFGTPDQSPDPIAAPPYECFQENGAYSIYFNMYGIRESDIRVGLNNETNQITIFAQREKQNFTDQFLWVFSLPANADLNSVQSLYKKGVVQFSFPQVIVA